MTEVKERRPPFYVSKWLERLKVKTKIIAKSFIKTKRWYPHRVMSFSDVLINPKKSRRLFYNRIENNNFKVDITPESLIAYPQSTVYCNKNLLLEGEVGRPYRLNKKHIAVTPKVTCYSLGNAVVAGAEGFIYLASEHRFISESLRQWFAWDDAFVNSYLSSLSKTQPTFHQGVSLSIAKPGADSYYHFLHEAIPAYLLIKKTYPEIKIDNVIVSGEKTKFKAEWLNFFIGNDCVIIYSNYTSNHFCEQLLFLSDLCHQYSPNNLTISLLKTLEDKANVLPLNKPFPTRIIASRKNAKVRNIDWEDELASAANATVIDFENFSPEEVIQLCTNCELFIGAHGAAFSNIVFCKPGTQVIEIAFGLDEVLYRRLSAVCGLQHIIFDNSQKEELLSYLKQSAVAE